MVAMPVARSAAEHGDDHLRAKGTHDRHHVAQQGIPGPVGVRLLSALAETEIVGAREELSTAVDSTRGEQLLGADHPEQWAELVADEVLSTVAAREREVRGLDLPSAGEPGDELRILVVGMRTDHEDARRDVEPGDRLTERSRATPLGGEEAWREKQGDEREAADEEHRAGGVGERSWGDGFGARWKGAGACARFAKVLSGGPP
jgi:hypothetical protein